MSLVLSLLPDYDGTAPVKGSPGSAGYDLTSCEAVSLPARGRSLVPTGLTVKACPSNVYLRIAPRSGLAVQGIDVAAGVVDSDYRGHIQVVLVNQTDKEVELSTGVRVAQLIPEMISSVKLTTVDPAGQCLARVESLVTERGSGGFGSTGVRTSTGPPDPLLPTYPADSEAVIEDKIRNAWLC